MVMSVLFIERSEGADAKLDMAGKKRNMAIEHGAEMSDGRRREMRRWMEGTKDRQYRHKNIQCRHRSRLLGA